jgi:hypothetical protein
MFRTAERRVEWAALHPRRTLDHTLPEFADQAAVTMEDEWAVQPVLPS